MIPKIIHYCWFGRSFLPQSAIKCIDSWRRLLPDYEIKEWNEDNFDVCITTYTEEAYRLGKYAFVSDYARFWILYHYGGLYFDVDVELLKPIDDIIARGPFMGLEKMEGSKKGDVVAVAAGLGLGTYKAHEFYREILEHYNHSHFISWRGKMTGTVVNVITGLLGTKGNIDKNSISYCAGLYIYPDEYFDPMNYYTGETLITANTRSIHHYAATWRDNKKQRLLKKHWLRLTNVLFRISVSLRRAHMKKLPRNLGE
jgi:mannosyltransferase OCH1-like enzyme